MDFRFRGVCFAWWVFGLCFWTWCCRVREFSGGVQDGSRSLLLLRSLLCCPPRNQRPHAGRLNSLQGRQRCGSGSCRGAGPERPPALLEVAWWRFVRLQVASRPRTPGPNRRRMAAAKEEGRQTEPTQTPAPSRRPRTSGARTRAGSHSPSPNLRTPRGSPVRSSERAREVSRKCPLFGFNLE